MIAVVQRVRRAEVRVPEAGRVAAIERGLLVLLGIEVGDGPAQVGWMSRRIRGLRIFEDDAGRMNRDVVEARGSLIVVSQFTLAADATSGNRPSFIRAARPEAAEPLFDQVVGQLRREGLSVQTGRFGAHMEVELVNDGPVTIPLRAPETPQTA